MACSCQKNTYEVVRPDGSISQKNLSQVDAAAAARRVGGTYRVTR